MRILENEDYMEYMEYMQNRYGGAAATSLVDFVQCTQVNQEAIEQYQQYLEWQQNVQQQQYGYQGYQGECDGDNEDCHQQYANAQQNNAGNNNYQVYDNLYIGPHCDSDGHTISLAVYSDNSCTTLMCSM